MGTEKKVSKGSNLKEESIGFVGPVNMGWVRRKIKDKHTHSWHDKINSDAFKRGK